MTQIVLISLCLDKDDLFNTISSIPFDFANIAKYLVVSPLSSLPNFVNSVSHKFPAIDFMFVIDDSSGVYNAMNLALKSLPSDFPFLFLNAGDYMLSSAYSLLNSPAAYINLYVTPKNFLWVLYALISYVLPLSPSSYARYLLRIGFMPCSHQNILFPPALANFFSFNTIFSISADYEHLLKLILSRQFPCHIYFHNIAYTSRGGISDTRRSLVIKQRMLILYQQFGFSGCFSFLPLYLVLLYISRLRLLAIQLYRTLPI
jgi:hypothetical protein